MVGLLLQGRLPSRRVPAGCRVQAAQQLVHGTGRCVQSAERHLTSILDRSGGRWQPSCLQCSITIVVTPCRRKFAPSLASQYLQGRDIHAMQVGEAPSNGRVRPSTTGASTRSSVPGRSCRRDQGPFDGNLSRAEVRPAVKDLGTGEKLARRCHGHVQSADLEQLGDCLGGGVDRRRQVGLRPALEPDEPLTMGIERPNQSIRVDASDPPSAIRTHLSWTPPSRLVEQRGPTRPPDSLGESSRSWSLGLGSHTQHIRCCRKPLRCSAARSKDVSERVRASTVGSSSLQGERWLLEMNDMTAEQVPARARQGHPAHEVPEGDEDIIEPQVEGAFERLGVPHSHGLRTIRGNLGE